MHRIALVISLALASLLFCIAGPSSVFASESALRLPFAAEEAEGSGEGSEGEGEEIFEECEGEEYELGECEEEELEEAKGKKGTQPPAECMLRSVNARAVADTKHDKLKLTVGYTTYEPVAATIEIGKGSRRIGSVRRQLGKSGVLRIVEKLAKGLAPKQIVVRIRIPSSPRYCEKSQTEKVRVG